MTNTLHRKGSSEDLRSDFVVFATPSRSISPELPEKMRRFTEIVLRHGPVNLAKFENMAMKRVDMRRVDEAMRDEMALTATFDNIEAVASVVADLNEADLGIPINISGLLEEVAECCRGAGLTRHSTEQSLGIFGETDRLPPREILEINTMCGHGIVGSTLVKECISEVASGETTAQEASLRIARPCVCGIFNTTRAEALLNRAAEK